jgi:hypothetical protein
MTQSILIFKTNITTFEQVIKVNNLLSGQSEIQKWNVDIEDCDKVLRIETSEPETKNVIDMLKPHHIYCEELM